MLFLLLLLLLLLLIRFPVVAAVEWPRSDGPNEVGLAAADGPAAGELAAGGGLAAPEPAVFSTICMIRVGRMEPPLSRPLLSVRPLQMFPLLAHWRAPCAPEHVPRRPQSKRTGVRE